MANIAARIGNGKVTHAATVDILGNLVVSCGAVHSRSTRRGSVVRQPAGTPVTCAKCAAAAPVIDQAPVQPVEQPLTFMQLQRLRGKAR